MQPGARPPRRRPSGRAGRRSGRRRSPGRARSTPTRRRATMPMIVGYGRPRAVISGSVSAALRRVSSASRACASTNSLSSAETPSRRCEACAARPGTVSRNVIAPAWATTMSRSDGSVMIARSPVAPARIAASVPCPPSSSDGTSATSSSPSSRSRSPAAPSARTAARIAATPPFMSQAPRPYRRAVADLAAPRIGGPGRGIAGRHDVEVARQDDRGAPPRRARPAR